MYEELPELPKFAVSLILEYTGRHHVLLGSRDLAKAKRAISSMEGNEFGGSNISSIAPLQIDVTSDKSIEAAVETVQTQYGRLDSLLNNAGIAIATSNGSGTGSSEEGLQPSLREQYRQQYDTNVFGPVIATEAFLPLLRKSTMAGGKRIGFTGSITSSVQMASESEVDNPLNGKNIRIYRSTKTALNMIMVSFARELEDEGFVVGSCCPGYCSTNLNSYDGYKDPREGAKMLVKTVDGSKKEVHRSVISEEAGHVPW